MRHPLTSISSFALLLISTLTFAEEKLETLEQRAGYALGANLGSQLTGNKVNEQVDIESLIQGLRDSLAGDGLAMTQEQMSEVMKEFLIQQQAREQAVAQETIRAGREFLAQNANKEGVTRTASGLQYQVISKGADAAAPRPNASSRVQVHYTGTLIDGTEFDSSQRLGEPVSFGLNQVIAGWTEGLQLMQVGDKFRFYIPPELGYGSRPMGPIPPNSVLIFEVELLAIEEG